ncbi:MAG TPA: DUF2332 domain-containing protein [Pseudolysinimonas sp.]
MTSELTISERYLRFAANEAHGVSAIFEAWATGVAHDASLLALLEPLSRPKQQPNLVFAAARWTGCPAGDFGDFREWMLDHWLEIESTILARSTQTNEAARCSALVTALAGIEGPVALLEVGASAGLCLYPDRYSYRFDRGGAVVALDPADGTSRVDIPCAVGDGILLPERLPQVVWRAGIDQSPIDVRNGDEVRWLETLIWPEHHERVDRLHAAALIAAADPPHLRHGDLVELLASTAEWAPRDATLVVFHSAVLNYVPPERRTSFEQIVRDLDAVWISNEGLGVLPDVDAQLPSGLDVRGFILARDGEPLALTEPHGRSIEGLRYDSE